MTSFSFERDNLESRPKRRGFIIRMFIIYSAVTLVCLGLVGVAVVNIASGNTGYIVMFSVFGLIGFLTGYWMLAYMRDLKAEVVVQEGEIQRKWVRGQVLEFFFQACYISVNGKIFVIPRLEYSGLLETDLVRIRCHPHSLTVESIERYDEISKRFIPADGGISA